MVVVVVLFHRAIFPCVFLSRDLVFTYVWCWPFACSSSIERSNNKSPTQKLAECKIQRVYSSITPIPFVELLISSSFECSCKKKKKNHFFLLNNSSFILLFQRFFYCILFWTNFFTVPANFGRQTIGLLHYKRAFQRGHDLTSSPFLFAGMITTPPHNHGWKRHLWNLFFLFLLLKRKGRGFA